MLILPIEIRDSPLKSQLRVIRIHPNGSSFTIGSIEGRCAIEYIDSTSIELQKKKYTFKCHRIGDIVCPVNAIAYHPNGNFATGGSDGATHVWDGENKKRKFTVPPFSQPISALDFNCDGTMLAMASSHTFENNQPGEPIDNNIYIKAL